MRKKILLCVCLLGISIGALAQMADPVVMKINGKPILRSEFEYSYNKNNTEGVIDKKTVSEYVDLFINYKLKVLAAEEAQLDTVSAFQKEFSIYRDQQIRPAMITDADVEKQAFTIYQQTKNRVDANGGLVKPSHILIGLKQTASKEEQRKAELLADSVYNALKKGVDFAELAKKVSTDSVSAVMGGMLSWLEKGQTLPEFDATIFSMKKGELSKPFMTAAGYHIVLLNDKQNFFPYDSVKTDIIRFIEMRGIREQIISQKIEEKVKEAGNNATAEQILAQKQKELEANDLQLKYLIQEYHDGLLLFEMSNKLIWQKAQNNDKALAAYFKKHKKKYVWDEPRFKGIAYYTKTAEDNKAVKKVLKKVPFNQWEQTLYSTFNTDSIMRVKAQKGMFKVGDNALVDREIFKRKASVQLPEGYSFATTYGKKMKLPETYEDVKPLVIADFQEQLEQEWVAQLRKKYVVEVYHNVLSTVNKH